MNKCDGTGLHDDCECYQYGYSVGLNRAILDQRDVTYNKASSDVHHEIRHAFGMIASGHMTKESQDRMAAEHLRRLRTEIA